MIRWHKVSISGASTLRSLGKLSHEGMEALERILGSKKPIGKAQVSQNSYKGGHRVKV
jgi:hypothetical protein